MKKIIFLFVSMHFGVFIQKARPCPYGALFNSALYKWVQNLSGGRSGKYNPKEYRKF